MIKIMNYTSPLLISSIIKTDDFMYVLPLMVIYWYVLSKTNYYPTCFTKTISSQLLDEYLFYGLVYK